MAARAVIVSAVLERDVLEQRAVERFRLATGERERMRGRVPRNRHLAAVEGAALEAVVKQPVAGLRVGDGDLQKAHIHLVDGAVLRIGDRGAGGKQGHPATALQDVPVAALNAESVGSGSK